MKGGFSPQAPRSSSAMHLPILTPATMRFVIGNNRMRAPMVQDFVEQQGKRMALVLDTSPAALQGHSHSYQTFQVGGLMEHRNRDEADAFQVFGDSISACFQHMLSMEAALFPFLFPASLAFHTADSGMSLVQYVNNVLFSPFTLCKPYMLCMHQLQLVHAQH